MYVRLVLTLALAAVSLAAPKYEVKNLVDSSCGSSRPSSQDLTVASSKISSSKTSPSLTANSDLLAAGSEQGNEPGQYVSSTQLPDFAANQNIFGSDVSVSSTPAPNLIPSLNQDQLSPASNILSGGDLGSFNLQNFNYGQTNNLPGFNLNQAYVSSTPAPSFLSTLNQGLVSSTEAPNLFSGDLSLLNSQRFDLGQAANLPLVANNGPDFNANQAYVSSTPAPSFLSNSNNGFVSSTLPPNFPSTLNQGLVSSTEAPNLFSGDLSLLNAQRFDLGQAGNLPLVANNVPNFNLNQAYVSSTPAPSFLSNSNNGFVSSTLPPNFPSTLNQGLVSSTEAPNLFSGDLSLLNSQRFSLGQAANLPLVANNGPDFNLNQAYVSSTPAPSFLSNSNDGFVSSTLPPNFLSTLNQGLVSSTEAPNLFSGDLSLFNSQKFGLGQTGYSPFVADNGQIINLLQGSQLLSGGQIPLRSGDYDSVSIQSSTTGGSLSDAFGVHETLETQSVKPEITKNVFLYSAPEEPEVIRPRVYFEPNKKSVNLVFIKAPLPPVLAPVEVVQPQQESPEKTVVYVLVKKPEQHQQILVKSAPPAIVRKPDVFFLKYKNEEEAKNAVEKVQQEQGHVNLENQSVEELAESRELFHTNGVKSKPRVTYGTVELLKQSGALPNFQPILTSTEIPFSTTGSDLPQTFSRLTTFNTLLNNNPYIYSTPSPQVEINQISSGSLGDPFVNIRSKPINYDLFNPFVSSTSAPPIVSSTVSPGFAFSTTVGPELSSLNSIFKKK